MCILGSMLDELPTSLVLYIWNHMAYIPLSSTVGVAVWTDSAMILVGRDKYKIRARDLAPGFIEPKA